MKPNSQFQKENDKKGGYVNLSFVPNTFEWRRYWKKVSLYLEAVLQTIQKLKKKGFSITEIL
jgi:hypothetical protein